MRTDSTASTRTLVHAANVLATIALIGYPVGMYLAMNGRGPRPAALLLLAAVAPAALIRLARRDGGRARLVALVPIVTVALLASSAALNRAGFALAVPSVVSAILLGTFGATLWSGPPLIERFARLQHPDLTEAEVAWCRLWTALWCVFLAVNGTVAGVLAATGETRAWALYSGGVAYGLMGAMFGVEWTIRKIRFGRRDGSLADRMLARLGFDGGSRR